MKKFFNVVVGVLLIASAVCFSRYLDQITPNVPTPVPTPTPNPTPAPIPTPLSSVWIVGLVNKSISTPSAIVWSLEGVYDTQDKALKVCTTPQHFLGPANINIDMSSNDTWPGSYFPLAPTQETAEDNLPDLDTK